MRLEDFPVSTGTINILLKAGYKEDKDLKGAKEKEISNLKGLGPAKLAELKVFLKGIGIKLEREKKEKKAPKYHPQSRELVKLLLPKGEINFSRETQAAGKLLEKFSFEELERCKLPEHVTSLLWLLSGLDGWATRWINQFAPIKVVQREEKVEEIEVEDLPEVNYKPAARPMDLASFMGLRK